MEIAASSPVRWEHSWCDESITEKSIEYSLSRMNRMRSVSDTHRQAHSLWQILIDCRWQLNRCRAVCGLRRAQDGEREREVENGELRICRFELGLLPNVNLWIKYRIGWLSPLDFLYSLPFFVNCVAAHSHFAGEWLLHVALECKLIWIMAFCVSSLYCASRSMSLKYKLNSTTSAAAHIVRSMRIQSAQTTVKNDEKNIHILKNTLLLKPRCVIVFRTGIRTERNLVTHTVNVFHCHWIKTCTWTCVCVCARARIAYSTSNIMRLRWWQQQPAPVFIDGMSYNVLDTRVLAITLMLKAFTLILSQRA